MDAYRTGIKTMEMSHVSHKTGGFFMSICVRNRSEKYHESMRKESITTSGG